jgi:hypothetical protein
MQRELLGDLCVERGDVLAHAADPGYRDCRYRRLEFTVDCHPSSTRLGTCSAGRPPRMSEPLVCSAQGCRAPASYAVIWNNPKIHLPEREKTWMACEEHRRSLADFLAARGFLRRVERL